MSLNDENLPRWIVASLIHHFRTLHNAKFATVPFIATGYDLEENEDEDHVEFRVQGPHIRQLPGETVVEVGISMLATHRPQQSTDTYLMDRWLGFHQSELQKEVIDRAPILITRCGSDTIDDNSLIGCLTLKKDKRSLVRCDRYGIIGKNDVPITQGTVVADFNMFL